MQSSMLITNSYASISAEHHMVSTDLVTVRLRQADAARVSATSWLTHFLSIQAAAAIWIVREVAPQMFRRSRYGLLLALSYEPVFFRDNG